MGREGVQEHHDRRLALGLPLREEVLVAPAADPLDVADAEISQLDGVAPHLAEGDAEIGLLPGPADRPLRQAAPVGVGDLLRRQVDQAVARRLQAEVARHLGDAAVGVEPVVDVGGLDDRDVGAAERVQIVGQLDQELRVGDDRAILPMVAEHEGRLDCHAQRSRRPSRVRSRSRSRSSRPACRAGVESTHVSRRATSPRRPRPDPPAPSGCDAAAGRRLRGKKSSPTAPIRPATSSGVNPGASRS